MPYDVRLPNGYTITDVPDDVDREAFRAKVFERFPELGAKQKRTWGEALTDTGASLAKGVGTLMQLPGDITDLAGITKRGESTLGLQGLGKELETSAEEFKSPVLKAKEAVRGQKIAAADGFAAEFGTAFKETLKDPALLTSFFTEQLPNLVGSAGGGLLAKGTAKVLMYNASKEALETILPKVAVGGAVGTGAIMQGADIGADTYESVYKELSKSNPDMSDEEKQGIALTKARVAALEAAALSLGASRLPGGASIERALVGKGLPGTGGFIKGMTGEALSEGIEEGGGKFISNIGVSEVAPDTDLMKGVGAAAGFGALGGALFGGPAGAINASFDAAQQKKVEEFEAQRTSTLAAIEEAQVAEEQARRDAFAAQQADINLRSIMERGDITESKAFEELSAEVETIKEKAAKAQAKADAARDKIDAEKAKFSAFAEAEPDLFGMVYPQVKEAAQQQEVSTQPAIEGQLELPLADEQGQLGLPEVGIAQPRQPSMEMPEAPAGRRVTEDDFKSMGVGATNKALRAEILGKDLTDPAQAAEVRTALENYASGDRSARIIKGVETFLSLPEFQEQQKLSLRRPYGSLKKPVPEQEAPAVEQTQEVPEDVRETAQDVAGIAEPSIYIPPGKRKPSGGITEGVAVPPTGRMASDISPVARPAGREVEVDTTLEPSTTLNKRQEKEFKDAAAKYIQQTNSPQQALDYLAGDLYAKENTTIAKRFKRGLNPEQLAYVEAKIQELKQMGRRGNIAVERMNRRQDIERARQAENPEKVAELEAELKEFDAKYKTAKLEREDLLGGVTPKLVNAVRAGDTRAALEEIVNDKTGAFNELEKLVARRLMQVTRKLPKIEVVDPAMLEGADGQYVPRTDTVQIADGQVDSHTVLHELVHGYLHAYITDFESGKIEIAKGLTDLKAVYEHVQKVAPELANKYGMESLTEFASEVMSNREFQNELKGIKYKRGNIFTEFARAVMRILGLNPNEEMDALAAAMIAADRSLATGRQFQETEVTEKQARPPVQVSRTERAEEIYNRRPDVVSKSKGPFQAIRETSREEAKAQAKNFLNKAETMLFSSDAALNNRIRQELERKDTNWDVLKEMMLQVSTSQAIHAEAVANVFLEKGDIEYDPNTYKFMAKESKDSWQNVIKQISAMANTHGLTFDQANKYANRAIIAKRTQGLKKTKPEFETNLTDEDIKADLEFYELFPELNQIQETWNGVRKNTMRIAVESGLYTEEQAKDLLDFMDYVPFYRVEQLAASAGPREYSRGLLDFAKNFKIRGSKDQQIEDIFDNMERWTSYTVSRAVKNRTALNMKNTALELMPDEVRELRSDARVKREQNTIDIWEDGVKKKYEFDDPLFVYAFQGVQPVALPILKGMAAVANVLRKNIVLMPLFSASQISQDAIGAMFTSGLKQPFKLPAEVIKEFVKTLKGTSAAAQELYKYGAVGVRDYSAAIARNDAEVAAGLKPQTKGQKALGILEKIAMASDNAVRQAIYNRTLAEGGDKATAVEKAFEIINFKRSGASGTVNVLRQVVPFFGAYLQAQNVAYKTLTGRGISPTQRNEAYRVLRNTTLKIMALGFIYAAMVSDDEDYQKLDPTVRDRHLLIPGTAFALPLRSDVFLLPKLAAEYTYQGLIDAGYTDSKKMYRGMKDAVKNAILSPTAVPQAVKPLLEVMVNYNFFTGRPIIGQGLENKITSEQYTNTTSELAKFLGKAGLVAPVNIDHLIRGYLGTTGGLGLMAINSAVNLGSDTPRPEKSWQEAIATTPGMSAFVMREYGSAAKNDYYELRKEVDKAVNTFNTMKKTGRIEEAKEFLEENKQLLSVKTQVNAIERQLAKVREREKIIYSLPESRMTAEEKGQEIERLREIEKRMLANVYKLREMAGF